MHRGSNRARGGVRGVASRGAAASLAALWAFCAAAACGSARETPGHEHETAVTLRFKPSSGQRWLEHWVYDLDAPGVGLMRTALSFDVSVLRPEPNSLVLKQVVRRQYHGREGRPEPLRNLSGTQLSWTWGHDRSLIGELNLESATLDAAARVREVALAMRFGTLIEYPDQTVSVGDSWSIEPRTLSVGPGLSATLRPSYSFESISSKTGSPVATIGADIQVDLIPEVVDDDVVMEGGGTASGTLSVDATDGVLLEARTILHFNQEVRVQGETLGYREFSATAHLFTTRAQPDLSAEPWKIERVDVDDVRACAGLLDVVAERVGRGSAPLGVFVIGALYSEQLPLTASAPALREPGSVLFIAADGRRLELNGVPVEGRDLAKTLRKSRAPLDPVYVFAPAGLTVERTRSVLALLPRSANPKLLVRVASSEAAPPKASRFVEEQLRAALTAATQAEQQARLTRLLVDHLVLCEGALEVQRKLDKTRGGNPDAAAEILQQIAQCGCTTTQVDGLELALQAVFGPAELRAVRVPAALRARRSGAAPGNATVQTLLPTDLEAAHIAPQ